MFVFLNFQNQDCKDSLCKPQLKILFRIIHKQIQSDVPCKKHWKTLLFLILLQLKVLQGLNCLKYILFADL